MELVQNAEERPTPPSRQRVSDPGTPIADCGLTVSDWQRLIGRSGLSPKGHHVALQMSIFADWERGDDIYPGNDLLARTLGYGTHTKAATRVGRTLRELRAAGWLVLAAEAVPQAGKSARYALSVPSVESLRYDTDGADLWGGKTPPKQQLRIAKDDT